MILSNTNAERLEVSHMLFHSPELTDREVEVVVEVNRLQEDLRLNVREPRRWVGSLRRASMARAIQGSNSIEGYDASLDDAAAVDLGEEPLDATQETTLALKGYRHAMTFVLQMASDDRFSYNEQLIKSLHYMMTSYDLQSRPGLWRIGAIFVENEHSHEIVYEGADVSQVPTLMTELIDDLNSLERRQPIVDAAMAHLNLVMVHPFRDGNGRMARCLQTLVLARQGIIAPVFSSVEEYLGKNTQAYYDVLAQVGDGSWRPDRDARPWVRFMLTAHLRQARTMLRRVKESERLWFEIEKLVKAQGLPERTFAALYDAAIGFRVRNATYRAMLRPDDDITDATASRDLKHLLEAQLLRPVGEKRGRYYTASPKLRDLWQSIVTNRDPRDDSDPFADELLPIVSGRLF